MIPSYVRRQTNYTDDDYMNDCIKEIISDIMNDGPASIIIFLMSHHHEIPMCDGAADDYYSMYMYL